MRLTRLNSATKRLSTGKVVTYWYAWRGGPRLDGKPGSHEFLASYTKAMKGRKEPKTETLASLVARYKASPEWAKNADSTKREWTRWLDRIAAVKGPQAIGVILFEELNDADIKAVLLDWRDQWQHQPRSADYAVQVLSRVLSWAKRRGLLKINAIEDVERLYESDRAEVIWEDAEIERYIIGAPSPEVAFIVPLACATGLRRGDLATLRWSEVTDIVILKPTSKSGGKKIAAIPLIEETKGLLAEIRKHRPDAEFVLTNTRGKQWTPSGLSHAVEAFGGKRLHDCRGTFATRLRLAGLTAPQIAVIMGWEEERVTRILTSYVDRNAVVLALARQLANGNLKP